MRREIQFPNTEEMGKALELLFENGQTMQSGHTNRCIVVWPICLELLDRAEIKYKLEGVLR